MTIKTTNYKGWNFTVEFNMVRITGYGTAGTFTTEADAVAFIDYHFPG